MSRCQTVLFMLILWLYDTIYSWEYTEAPQTFDFTLSFHDQINVNVSLGNFLIRHWLIASNCSFLDVGVNMDDLARVSHQWLVRGSAGNYAQPLSVYAENAEDLNVTLLIVNFIITMSASPASIKLLTLWIFLKVKERLNINTNETLHLLELNSRILAEEPPTQTRVY